MKKLLLGLLLAIFCLLPSFSFASYTLGDEMTAYHTEISKTVRIVFVDCNLSNDSDDSGTFTRALADDLFGYYLYSVTIMPASGGTAPTDNSDIFIYDEFGQDLLGSEDCASGACTTPYRGLNAVDSTSTVTLIPNLYQPGQGTHQAYYPAITGLWTIRIINNSQAGADVDIYLKFVK